VLATAAHGPAAAPVADVPPAAAATGLLEAPLPGPLPPLPAPPAAGAAYRIWMLLRQLAPSPAAAQGYDRALVPVQGTAAYAHWRAVLSTPDAPARRRITHR